MADRTVQGCSQDFPDPLERGRRQWMRPLRVRPQQRGEHRLYLADRQIPVPQRHPTQARLEVIPNQLGMNLTRGRPADQP